MTLLACVQHATLVAVEGVEGASGVIQRLRSSSFEQDVMLSRVNKDLAMQWQATTLFQRLSAPLRAVSAA